MSPTVQGGLPHVEGRAHENQSVGTRSASDELYRPESCLLNPCERTDSHLAVRALSADLQPTRTQLLRIIDV
jgi:hypothetical protein